MLHRRVVLLGGLIASAAYIRARAAAPTDDQISGILDAQASAVRTSGIVAAVSDPTGSRVFSKGYSGSAENRPLDGESVFEIGSITKVLTALLLADMAERGEVAVTDPVTRYLPPMNVPEWIRHITLLDLATYTSGLPNLPCDFKFNGVNPLADYTPERVYSCLPTYALRYEPGTHYEYANLGYGLLGLALAMRAGKDYEALLVERICEPLGLHSTRITLTDNMRSRLAQGHDQRLNPTPLWDLPGLAGAGAVRSTANDLTVLLEA